jgi:plasmid stability protein
LTVGNWKKEFQEPEVRRQEKNQIRWFPAGITSAVPHCDSIDSNASIESIMATITIRQLDEETKTRLRVRAAHHGRSMEEEAREILRSALRSSPPAGNLAEAIRRRFAAFGGVELKLPRRDAVRELPEFDK